MRCPRCKETLISGQLEKFETISDHVIDPNAADHPLRKTFICPNSDRCLRGFFDVDGDYYRKEKELSVKVHWSALDSFSRRFAVENKVSGPWVSHKTSFFHYLKDIYDLHIWGEKDIPADIFTLWKYFVKAKYKHYKSVITFLIPLRIGLKSYAFEKGNRLQVIKSRIFGTKKL